MATTVVCPYCETPMRALVDEHGTPSGVGCREWDCPAPPGTPHSEPCYLDREPEPVTYRRFVCVLCDRDTRWTDRVSLWPTREDPSPAHRWCAADFFFDMNPEGGPNND